MDENILQQYYDGSYRMERTSKKGVVYECWYDPNDLDMYYPLCYKGVRVWVAERKLIELGLVDMLREDGIEMSDL